MSARAKLLENARKPRPPQALPPSASASRSPLPAVARHHRLERFYDVSSRLLRVRLDAAEAPPGRHQGRHRATKRTPRQELKWVQSQIERADEPLQLTPREHQQVAQWKRIKREDRAMEVAAQEILETAALPDKPQTFRYVWTKNGQGSGFSQQWMPMEQWKKERGGKFKLLAKAAKLTTSYGVGAGSGAKVFGAGIAGVAKQTEGRPMIAPQDEPTAQGVEQQTTRQVKPSDECYHCRRLGHWKRDCPMLQPGYDYRKHQPEALRYAKQQLKIAQYNQEDPHIIDIFEQALQREEARFAQFDVEVSLAKTPPSERHFSAPLPPKLRGPRWEDVINATQYIQKHLRGRQARRKLNEQKAAAIQIQAIHRGKFTRSQLQRAVDEPAEELEPEPDMMLEVVHEVVSAAMNFAVVAAYDDIVEAAIAGVIHGSNRALPLSAGPESRHPWRKHQLETELQTEPEAEAEPEPEPKPDVFSGEAALGENTQTLDVAKQPQMMMRERETASESTESPVLIRGSSDDHENANRRSARGDVGIGGPNRAVRGHTGYLSDASRVPGQRATAYGPSARVASFAPSTHGLWPATESTEGNAATQLRKGRKIEPGSATVAAGRAANVDPTKHRRRRSVTFSADEKGAGSVPGSLSTRKKQAGQAKWRQHIPGPGGVKQIPGDKNHGRLG